MIFNCKIENNKVLFRQIEYKNVFLLLDSVIQLCEFYCFPSHAVAEGEMKAATRGNGNIKRTCALAARNIKIVQWIDGSWNKCLNIKTFTTILRRPANEGNDVYCKRRSVLWLVQTLPHPEKTLQQCSENKNIEKEVSACYAMQILREFLVLRFSTIVEKWWIFKQNEYFDNMKICMLFSHLIEQSCIFLSSMILKCSLCVYAS